jgi:hypothetical protein
MALHVGSVGHEDTIDWFEASRRLLDVVRVHCLRPEVVQSALEAMILAESPDCVDRQGDITKFWMP